MKKERGIPLLVDAQPEAVAEALTQSPIVMIGCRDLKNPEKISGVSEEMLQAYEKLADLVLVEADGAKRLPLKAPAGWEPVLPGRFDVVIGVARGGCRGKALCGYLLSTGACRWTSGKERIRCGCPCGSGGTSLPCGRRKEIRDRQLPDSSE